MRKASSTTFDTKTEKQVKSTASAGKVKAKVAGNLTAKASGNLTAKTASLPAKATGNLTVTVAATAKQASKTHKAKPASFAEKASTIKVKALLEAKQNELQQTSINEKSISIDTTQIAKLLDFDRKMRKKWLLPDHPNIILGTDEVGRGCLAGPVVAAAVILPEFTRRSPLGKALALLDDSKKLSPKTRADLAAILQENCVYAIGQASAEEIDKINILKASLLAMSRAIAQLEIPESSALLVDGNQRITDVSINQILVVGGDGISASIAAASVIAKVYRDDLMAKLHNDFPHYSWNSNKGYGSKTHCQAIVEKGLSPFHRQSFCSRIMNEQLLIPIPE